MQLSLIFFFSRRSRLSYLAPGLFTAKDDKSINQALYLLSGLDQVK
jgi:hypothetical protein